MAWRFINWKMVQVEEFEGALALAFHLRQKRWEDGEIDAERNAALSRLGNMLYAAGLTGH